MNEDALPLLAGVRLNDRYIVSRTLGVGGFGITYLAWDEEGVRQVVVKECMPTGHVCRDAQGDVRPVSSESAQVLAACIANTDHEIGALQRLDVDGVVKFYDHFLERGTIYYAMEYVEGESLQEIADVRAELGQHYEAEEIKGLLLNLLEILDKVHKQGIYHCDIKPGNVLITPEGKTVLIDFGAVRSRELPHAGAVQVSPGYSPPEFYPGFRREIGPWTDLYELGATFYRLLSGRIPEPGDQRSMRDRTQRLALMPALKDLYPQPLLVGVDKALSPSIRDRYPTARAWIDYLGKPQGVFMMPALSARHKSRALARASVGAHAVTSAPQSGVSARMVASMHAGQGVKRPTRSLGSNHIPRMFKDTTDQSEKPDKPVLTNKGITLKSFRSAQQQNAPAGASASASPAAAKGVPSRVGMKPAYTPASKPQNDMPWMMAKVALVLVVVFVLGYLIFGRNNEPEPSAPAPAPKQRVYKGGGGMGVPAPAGYTQPRTSGGSR